MTIETLLARVHRRTGAIARSLSLPHLASNSDQSALLLDFLETGAALAARHADVAEDVVTIAIDGTMGAFALDRTVSAVMRAELELGSGRRVELEHGSGHARAAASAAASFTDGIPSLYAIFGGTLYLDRRPPAGSVLRLFVLRGSLVVDDVDEVTSDVTRALVAHLPQDLAEGLVLYVAGEWLDTVATTPVASAKGQAMQDAFRQIVAEFSNARRPSTARMRPTY
jgi:hypothetical protein